MTELHVDQRGERHFTLQQRKLVCSIAGLEDTNDVPTKLYHFSDAAGVAGILSQKVLWLSWAQGLNDASEVQYALELALQELQAHTGIGCSSEFAQRVRAYLEQDAVTRCAEPFVASFCAGDTSALHWLTYGRAGNGYAIGFNTGALAAQGFFFSRVIYTEAEQRELVRGAIRAHVEHGGPFAGQQPVDAALACATALRLLGCRMKSPPFAVEEEWRLITVRWLGPEVAPTKLRAVGNRLVPYVTSSFESECVNELVLGYSTPEHQARSVLALAGFRNTSVRRSLVSAR